MMDKTLKVERIILNTEFTEDGNTVNMAVLDYKMEGWIKVGHGLVEMPTIKLTPNEVIDLIVELQHYHRAATGGDA
jgi:hypothetical protein